MRTMIIALVVAALMAPVALLSQPTNPSPPPKGKAAKAVSQSRKGSQPKGRRGTDEPAVEGQVTSADKADQGKAELDKKADEGQAADKKAGEGQAEPERKAGEGQAAPDQKAGEAQAGEEKPEAAPKPAPWVSLNLGATARNFSGNETKWRQYSTPPTGLYLRELRLAPAIMSGHQGMLSLKAPGEDDYRYDGWLGLFYGRTTLDGYLSRSRFFAPTPTLIDSSNRILQNLYVRQVLRDALTLTVQYRMDEQNQFFEVPKTQIHQRTRFTDLALQGKVGPGRAVAGYTDWRFFDRTEIQPSTNLSQWNLGYQWDPSPALAFDASFVRQSFDTVGGPKNHIETLALGGGWALGPNTDISASWTREKIGLNVVQNAYVRDRRVGALGLQQYWRGWSLRMGLRQRDAERVRADQSYVDTPRWLTFDGRLSGRLGRDVRLTARGSTETLHRAPQMLTDDPRSLYFDSRAFAQLKLEATAPTANAYLIGTYNRRDISSRQMSYVSRVGTLGGDFIINPRVNAFAEYTFDTASAKSDIVEFPVFDTFAPNSRLAVLGLNWTVDGRTYVWTTYNEYSALNDNPLRLRDANAHGRFLNINVRHRFQTGYDVGLSITPYFYRDAVAESMDYSTTLFMLNAAARF
jgi:hypothetical protein